jgi:hypothetical protein
LRATPTRVDYAADDTVARVNTSVGLGVRIQSNRFIDKPGPDNSRPCCRHMQTALENTVHACDCAAVGPMQMPDAPKRGKRKGHAPSRHANARPVIAGRALATPGPVSKTLYMCVILTLRAKFSPLTASRWALQGLHTRVCQREANARGVRLIVMGASWLRPDAGCPPDI